MTSRLLAGLAAAAALAASSARADDPTKRQFDPDPSRLALSLDGGFAVETAGAQPARMHGFAAILDLTTGLLSLQLGSQRDQLLEHRLSLHLLGAWSVGWAELSAEVPVALWQQSDFSLLTDQGVTGPLVAPIAQTAFGDIRLGAKVPLLRQERFPIGLAAMLDLRLPTGNGDAFYSDGLAAVPSVVATRAFGRVRLDAQLGYHFRGTGQYAQLVVHDGWTYGAGVNVDLPRAGFLQRWRALAEITGGLPRGWDSSSERYRAPLSARAGLRWFVTPEVSVELGGGAGLGETGYGREEWRVFGGIRWTRLPAGALPPDEDTDHDGVPNSKDRCPREAGPAELEGCPDRDGDGIPDIDDKCPDQPGPVQNEGCPLREDEPLVQIENERLSLRDSVHFDTGKDTIQSASFKLLDQVAALLNEHTELKKIRIEGHTDNVGSGSYNKDLSLRRARSVVRYLAEKGKVAPSRLEAAGYGFERPVASNATAAGRSKNRRVDFTILGEP
jgi:outer membrane protein OmpA-like peptidoglycan-associated protein